MIAGEYPSSEEEEVNPIVPTAGPKAAIVQQANNRQACRDLAKMLAKDEARRTESLKKFAADDKAALITKWHFGGALLVMKTEIGHGEWMAFLEEIEVDQRRANECMQIALVSRMKIEELGSQRAVARYLREHAEAEAKATGQIGGAANLDDDDETPESGEGAAPTAAAGATPSAHSKPKPTVPSPAAGKPQKPAGEQQSLPGMEKPDDPEAAKKRLDKKTRSQARGLAARLAEIHKEFGQLMRCKDAPVTEEIRRLYRLSGLHIEDRQPPETASGFEDRQQSSGVCWRELEAAERLLSQAAGRDT